MKDVNNMVDSPSMGISKKSAAYVASVRDMHRNDAVRAAAVRCCIDWMGCVLGGFSTPEAKIVRDVATETGCRGAHSVFGGLERVDLLNAAFVNGCTGHVLEMDDVHQASVLHPGVVVFSTAVALAEKTRASGARLLDAVTAGYDFMIRMGEAAGPTHYAIWHSTATCGAFGAAAAAANLLGLSEEQTLWAIGNAGSQAAGLWEFASDGAMTKLLHCGKAAMNGLLAALLASRGFTGATRIVEGERGFLRATSKEPRHDVFDDFGHRFAILETAFKPYASCRHTHAIIDAVLVLCGKTTVDPSKIRKISIETYPVATEVAGATRHDAGSVAKFNMRYCAARALLDGSLGVGAFSRESLNDPRVDGIIEKMHVRVADDITRSYPSKWPARVTIETDDGEFSETVEYPSGDPRNPVSDEALEHKYIDLAHLSVDMSVAEDLLERCRTVFEAPDVAVHFSGGRTDIHGSL